MSWAALLAVVVASAMIATGCGSGVVYPNDPQEPLVGDNNDNSVKGSRLFVGPKDTAETPKKGGRIAFGLDGEPEGMDPARAAFDISAHTMASAVFDSLAVVDADGNVVPSLAQAIEPSADFRTWTITLRPGVHFHDGSTLDAEALKVNFEYLTFSFITAAALKAIDRFEVVDPLRMKLTMKQPWASFPYVLTTQAGYVAAPTFLKNPDPNGPQTRPVGTGPFRQKSWVKGKSFTVERNPDYWQRGLPYLDEIQFQFMTDALAREKALDRGEIDVLHAYQPSVVQWAREGARQNELKVVENGEGEEDAVAINTEKPPFDDIDARRALAHATDASKWREITDVDPGREVHGPFARGQIGFSEDDGYPRFDPEKARQLVVDYERKHPGKRIEAEYTTTENVDDRMVAQMLIDQWARVGIRVRLKSVPLGSLIFNTVMGDYQLVGWRNFGALDPDGEYLWWHSSAVSPKPRISTNVARYSDAQIDRALDEARGTTDTGIRDGDYQLVAKRLNEGVAYIWLGRPTWVLVARTRVEGMAAAVNGTGVTIGNKPWLTFLWLAN